MKSIVLIFICLVMSIISNGQSTQMKTYCFGEKEDVVIQRLSNEAKDIVSKIFLDGKVDTTKWYRVKWTEGFVNYTNGKYLKENSHIVYNWVSCNDNKPVFQSIRRIKSINHKLDKIFLLYSISEDKQCQNLVVYLLN